MTYSEKLLDPRWQKKRLEILQRDNFTCQITGCFETTKTLHVHHLDYLDSETSEGPWDYPDNYLITVCEDCHNEINERRKKYEKRLIHAFRLHLKDPFIQKCAVEIFERSSNLNDLIFSIWDFGTEECQMLINSNHI